MQDFPTELSFVGDFTYDLATQTASWEFDDELAPGQYLIRLSDGIFDLDHDALDGEFSNPWALADAADTADTLPSGNGVAGGEFRFRFTNLAGDFDGDNVVDDDDADVWDIYDGISNATSTRQGDGNGDGNVDYSDIGQVYSPQYGTDYQDWPVVEPGMVRVTTETDEDGVNFSAVSLREALDAVASGSLPGHDTIVFAPWVEEIVLTEGELDIDSDVTILGPGRDLLTISGDDQVRIIDIAASTDVTIEGLTLSDGSVASGSGGAVYNAGDLTLRASRITDSYAGTNGGGVFSSAGSTLTIFESEIIGNEAVLAGGGIDSRGTTYIERSTIAQNQASFSLAVGGGLNVFGGTTKVVNSTISGNDANTGGVSTVRSISNWLMLPSPTMMLTTKEVVSTSAVAMS
jgi:hypothetical protein